MIKFHILRSIKDIFGHIILICLPIILISIFRLIYSSDVFQTGVIVNLVELTTFLSVGFALTFQIYGSAISFETLGQDFLSPMRDRLLASPESPRKMVTSILFTSVLVSFIQTVVIIVFSIIILEAEFNNLLGILLILLLSVIVHQLIGTIILFLSKKVRTATSITSLYGIIAPAITRLYFPLPDTRLFNFLDRYSTPMSLAKTAILGIINGDYKDILIGVIPLTIIAVILYILVKPLSKKVII